ncbi:uncharacterized protein DSM5745_02603 [Aspergillus mulundensis]|uniref:DUF8035 domain-containing protein n=1 Tax=Aspergillus mulundensis TaxID=1810919 RepID=A0A3D8SYH7_9EURO|nr:Uncharacterized protein DSM5745_02603 [Aspergillus mulundensis]RDW90828.1 Uncharacterized protein DSM5745_02603 [Aspergillus mulundensis]
MPRYSELDSETDYYARESRGRHHSRGPAVLERPTRKDEFRWDSRLQETDRYGPPARRPSRHYDDDHLRHGGALVRHERRHAESPPPRPRMLRRQSSLDTYDRIPLRKIDEYYRGYLPKGAPSPPPLRRRAHRDEIETIQVPARETRYKETVEEIRPYPRKGKTRMPDYLVSTKAIREFGYPYEREGDLVIIQLALSKEQIDAIIERSRELKRQPEVIPIRARSHVRATSRRRKVETVTMGPRASETLIIEPSPERYVSPSRPYDYSTTTTKRIVSRSRSISVKPRRRRYSSPPPRMVMERRSGHIENPGAIMIVSPRDSDSDLNDWEIDNYRPPFDPTTALYGDVDGDEEEVLEVKQKRRGPPARTLRRMLATMT